MDLTKNSLIPVQGIDCVERGPRLVKQCTFWDMAKDLGNSIFLFDSNKSMSVSLILEKMLINEFEYIQEPGYWCAA